MSPTSTKPYKDTNLPLVPEATLRKRHDLDELVQKRAAASTIAKTAKTRRGTTGGTKKVLYVKKPEQFLAKAKTRQNHTRRYTRIQRKGLQSKQKIYQKPNIVQVEKEDEDTTSPITTTTTDNTTTNTTTTYQSNSVGAKVVFVVRIRDTGAAVPPNIRRALSHLRLRHLYDGVFVRYTSEAQQKLLHLLDPYVVYGPPTAAVVQDLIQRRGYGKSKDDGKRIPLSDNLVIEQAFAHTEHNLLCVEDLVHEIVTVGDAFTVVNQFLWPFRLTDTKTKFERQILKLKDGKHYGDQGDKINEYIKQIL
jgi:large subunit ribosomal protein L7e